MDNAMFLIFQVVAQKSTEYKAEFSHTFSRPEIGFLENLWEKLKDR